MQLVRQPPYSKACGPACVATVLGVSLEYAITLVGKTGKTRWVDLRDALRKAYCEVPDTLRMIRMEGMEMPGLAICRLYWGAGWEGSHWLVKHGDKVLDPAFGEYAWDLHPAILKEMLETTRVRITSFASIKLPDYL